MPTLTFTWDLSKATPALADKLQAAVAAVIPEQLEVIRDVWVAAVSGVQLPGMAQRVNSSPYAAALQKREAVEFPWGGRPLAGRVVVRDQAAVRVERGQPSRDMKPGLLAGPKARRGKKGQRFNVIPLGFRSPKPGAFSPGYMSGLFHATSPFRTVSDFSPADSWWYPARPGVEVVESVLEYTRPLVAQALRETILREWR